MRRIIRPTFALAAMLITAVTFVISSCEDDNNGVVPENKTPTAPTGQVSDITFYTADITGKLELSKDELKQSEFGLLLSTSDDVMAVNSTKYPIKKFDKDYSFTLSLDGLDSVTTYYYRSYIYFEGNYFYSDVQEFTTKSPLDIIQTGNIESDSCTVKTLVNSKNLLDHIQLYGISYGVNKLPLVATDSTVTTNSIGTDGRFTLKMRNIPFDTIVNYRAYVRVNNVDYYGPTLQFQGNTVRTGIINISNYTVKSHLKINDGYKELGVCYGMDSIPEIFDQKVSTTALNDSNDFKLKLVNIPFDTIVYYRAYALTADSVYYGSINSFGGNTVTTGIIDTITFQVQSSVRFNDGISEYGVCYSNSEVPVTLDKKVSVQQLDSVGCYTLSLTHVPFGTVYYRSYVIKDDIAYYGDVRKFEGNGINTGDFNAESLKAQSLLRFSNSYDNPELGICYSNNQEPTIADKHVFTTVSDTTCTYELLLRNMPFGAVYYRAYMMYDGFPVYGEIKQIEGNAVTTSTFVDGTLTANSSIRYSIGYDALNIGVCYSNNTTPTVNDKVITANTVDSLNTFAVQLTEVPFGKVYYRSYMMYEGVPQYGDVKSFEGNSISTGSFNDGTLTAISNLKFSAGYKNLDLGVCYSTNEQPTINDKKVTTTSVDSLNAFALQLTEIPFGKVYYRSYMMYEGVPQYGVIKSFEGNSISTGSFNDGTLMAISNLKFSAGYKNLDLGVCYSTNEQPTINDKKVTTTSVDSLNSFALQLTEIPFGKVYYRSYMMFEGSPQYGDVKSFDGNSITTGAFAVDALTAQSSIKYSTGYGKLDLGICYSTNAQPTINDKKVSTSSVDSLNSFAIQLTEIPFGKVYYRSYMIFEDTPYYGEVKSFDGNVITTGSFNENTLTAISNLKFSAGYKNLDLGVCYSTNEQPTINDKKVTTTSVDSLNSFALQLTEIPFGIVYYRSYMMYDGVPQYGTVKSFEGNTITTGTYNDDSLTITSGIKISKGYNNINVGVCYSNNEQPTINDVIVSTNSVDSLNTFTLQLKDIPFGKVYYRSYMMLDGLAHYGDVKSFEGNEITTGIIDSVLSVRSCIKHNQGFYSKPMTFGICYGTNNNPTVNDLTLKTYDIDAENCFTVTISSFVYGTDYYYRSFVIFDGVEYYGGVKSFKIDWPIADAVDLGLSVNWATFNVGSSKPEERGYYYSWGETEMKNYYNESSYKWCNGSYYGDLTKYNRYIECGKVDNKTNLDIEDDVANMKWGGNWRLPTGAEIEELRNKCNWSWTSINGINGYIVSSTIPGYTNNSIFLPAAGYNDNGLQIDGFHGVYWSSSLIEYTYDYSSKVIYFSSGEISPIHFRRYTGCTVRPVCQSESWLKNVSMTLNRSSITLLLDRSYSLTALVKHGNETINSDISWSSSNPSVASVSETGVVTSISAGTTVITASCLYKTAVCTIIVLDETDASKVEHEYVDLGLGVKWATFNVGAISVDDYGDYFAWGEIETKTERYTNTNYKYYNSEEEVYTKYVISNKIGTVDNKVELEPEDDVAYVKWGGEWRMPTSNECSALIDNCSWTRDTINGVPGFTGYSKIEGFTDKSIFLPSSGSSTNANRVSGCYWSSSVYGSPPIRVTGFTFQSYDKKPKMEQNMRYYGFTVRPVHP